MVDTRLSLFGSSLMPWSGGVQRSAPSPILLACRAIRPCPVRPQAKGLVRPVSLGHHLDRDLTVDRVATPAEVRAHPLHWQFVDPPRGEPGQLDPVGRHAARAGAPRADKNALDVIAVRVGFGSPHTLRRHFNQHRRGVPESPRDTSTPARTKLAVGQQRLAAPTAARWRDMVVDEDVQCSQEGVQSFATH